MGQVCGDVNRNLKWAFVEIGNLIVINQRLLHPIPAPAFRLFPSACRPSTSDECYPILGLQSPGPRLLASVPWVQRGYN